MKVLVTGSNGYIARGVIKGLLVDGHDVVALGLKSSGLESERLIERIGNIFSSECTYEKVGCPDVMLHLAWRNGFDHYNDSHIADLDEHYHFIQRMAEGGLGRIAIMGSMHEVGYYEGAVDELTPCNPTTPYGVAKNALRQLAEGICARENVSFQWLRGFYLVSDDGKGDSIFAKIVHAEQEGKKEFPFTSGKCKYDFLPYESFCRQVVNAITQEDVSGIINICSGEPIALGEYIEDFIRDHKLNITLAYGKYPDRPYDSPAIWGDPTKIKRIMKSASTRVSI